MGLSKIEKKKIKNDVGTFYEVSEIITQENFNKMYDCYQKNKQHVPFVVVFDNSVDYIKHTIEKRRYY